MRNVMNARRRGARSREARRGNVHCRREGDGVGRGSVWKVILALWMEVVGGVGVGVFDFELFGDASAFLRRIVARKNGQPAAAVADCDMRTENTE